MSSTPLLPTTTSQSTDLIPSTHSRDAAFSKIMHGTSADEKSTFMAMIKKDSAAQAMAADAYFKHWDGKDGRVETEEDREERKEDYANLTRNYYDLATGLYEEAWGQSFHFCRFAPHESFHQAIARHEHYLASTMGLKSGMRVLDVGCGVGGPAREIARFADCHVTGLNINDYQIKRATRAAALCGMSNQLKFVKGDFMHLPFPDNSFDAVYAIEATCHAPSLAECYAEIFRVLKPGGIFGNYEWLMTPDYDPLNTQHRTIRLDIEQGNGIANLVPTSSALSALHTSGFTILESRDLSLPSNLAYPPILPSSSITPWYYPLTGDFRYLGSLGDLLIILRMTRFVRFMMEIFLRALEFVGLAPTGAARTANSLARAADGLVKGASEGLFTPMFLLVARKPEAEMSEEKTRE
ncbi:probable DELTA(24)-STEROL C-METHYLTRANSFERASE (ERG6) [Rhynchosporium agropyri]|uniref:Sterol 24-C-methyltransferase n=1 Tax=Rhynchosporium agropyri TaxID=914238 RepID=A0A1E1LPL8_9HELO|nr:probable DELTA(24)-STEROL C-METHYLTRANSFERASE (ERG6) [Rhynchosporium agropyri]